MLLKRNDITVIHRAEIRGYLVINLLKNTLSLVPAEYIDEGSNAIKRVNDPDKWETACSQAYCLPSGRITRLSTKRPVRNHSCSCCKTSFGIYELQINPIIAGCTVLLQYCHFEYSVLPARNH